MRALLIPSSAPRLPQASALRQLLLPGPPLPGQSPPHRGQPEPRGEKSLNPDLAGQKKRGHPRPEPSTGGGAKEGRETRVRAARAPPARAQRLRTRGPGRRGRSRAAEGGPGGPSESESEAGHVFSEKAGEEPRAAAPAPLLNRKQRRRGGPEGWRSRSLACSAGALVPARCDARQGPRPEDA